MTMPTRFTIVVEVEDWPTKDSDGWPLTDPGSWLVNKLVVAMEDDLNMYDDEIFVEVGSEEVAPR